MTRIWERTCLFVENKILKKNKKKLDKGIKYTIVRWKFKIM